MKIKTADLIGPALDWAVAKCEDVPFSSLASSKHYFAPSRLWFQGGSIIEREGITTTHMGSDWEDAWKARTGDGHWQGRDVHWQGRDVHGPTPLVSAMRAYVASKLGDEVEVPDDFA